MKGKILFCPSCIFAKAKRRAWCGRGAHDSIRKPTQVNLGNGTYIDQVFSAHAGLVSQMDGRHTRSRIHCGTVFFDQVSSLSFTHLQYSTGDIDTIAAKRSYELFTGIFGVIVKAYHADNGIFAENFFRDEVSESNQVITYCAVGAHHQNGIIESHIGVLTCGSRYLLLHAQRRWHSVVTTWL